MDTLTEDAIIAIARIASEFCAVILLHTCKRFNQILCSRIGKYKLHPMINKFNFNQFCENIVQLQWGIDENCSVNKVTIRYFIEGGYIDMIDLALTTNPNLIQHSGSFIIESVINNNLSIIDYFMNKLSWKLSYHLHNLCGGIIDKIDDVTLQHLLRYDIGDINKQYINACLNGSDTIPQRECYCPYIRVVEKSVKNDIKMKIQGNSELILHYYKYIAIMSKFHLVNEQFVEHPFALSGFEIGIAENNNIDSLKFLIKSGRIDPVFISVLISKNYMEAAELCMQTISPVPIVPLYCDNLEKLRARNLISPNAIDYATSVYELEFYHNMGQTFDIKNYQIDHIARAIKDDYSIIVWMFKNGVSFADMIAHLFDYLSISTTKLLHEDGYDFKMSDDEWSKLLLTYGDYDDFSWLINHKKLSISEDLLVEFAENNNILLLQWARWHGYKYTEKVINAANDSYTKEYLLKWPPIKSS